MLIEAAGLAVRAAISLTVLRAAGTGSLVASGLIVAIDGPVRLLQKG
jgi:hypothetical protein